MDLTTIEYKEDRITLSARELHEFLEVKSKYADWFKNMTTYGFAENVDYQSFSKNLENGGRTIDHEITVDMAKEIAMIQRNEKGRQARQYFIQLEKDWNSPEKIMARALIMSNKELNSLRLQNVAQTQQIAEMKPKADYVDRILQNKGLVTITAIAKDYGMSAIKFNELLHEHKIQFKQSDQWFLYTKYQDKGYTHSSTTDIEHKDGTVSVKMNTKWTQKGRLFLYEFLKERDILPRIELN